MLSAKKWLALLLIVGWITLALFGTPHPARAEATTVWKFQLERLRVVQAQEDTILEDGDEPYFVAIRFGSQYSTAASTEGFWSGELNEDWAKGVDTGDERDIPTQMGQVDFNNIDIITRDDYDCRNVMPEGGGVLIVAMEHDLTPWDLVDEIMLAVRDAITTELTSLVANGGLDLNNAEPAVRAAVDRIVDKTSFGFWKSAEIAARSFGFPDDFIGYYVFLFGAADPRVKDALTIPVVDRAKLTTFENLRYAIGTNPLVFVGDDAHYEVTAALTAITAVPQVAITGLQIKVPATIPVNASVLFEATVSQGHNVTFDWDWGDGSEPEKCSTATHAYATAGMYSVKVTASSNGQPAVSHSISVRVSPTPTKSTVYLPTIRNATVTR